MSWPQHEDIQRMAGFARMFHGDAERFPAILESAEDERRHASDEDYASRSVGEQADEAEEQHEDAEDRGDLRDDGRSFGYGESYGERQ